MRPTDSRGMAAMYLSRTDDGPRARRRALLATPLGWALASADALAAPATNRATDASRSTPASSASNPDTSYSVTRR